MMVDKVRDHADSWRLKAPESVRKRCHPAELMRLIHGVTVDTWACPACGHVYRLEDYPASYCLNCRRPLATRCTSVDDEGETCDSLVEPEPYNLGKREVWAEPGPYCTGCLLKQSRKRRADTVKASFPEKELAKLRDGYHRYHHRFALDSALERWIETNCGRDIGKPWVLAWGGTGSGKTLSLLYHGAAAYHGKALVDSVVYVTEEELTRAASEEWSRDDSERDSARALVKRCMETELLILDELGALPQYTDAQYRCYTRLLKLRIDGSKPTLIAMNRDLAEDGKGDRKRPLAWLDVRVDSRLEELATVVACTGVDLRRKER